MQVLTVRLKTSHSCGHPTPTSDLNSGIINFCYKSWCFKILMLKRLISVKNTILFMTLVAIGTLMWMDFNVSVVNRIDSLLYFSQAIRNFSSEPAYSSTAKFPFNVPSYLAVHMTKELNTLSDMANYKEVSLNPINGDNIANEREASILSNNSLSRTYRAYFENNNIYLTSYDPIKVKQSCILCHGPVDTAPEKQIELYGRKNGYSYHVGETYGLKVASIDITFFLLRYVGLALLFFVPGCILISYYNQKLNEAMNIDSLSGALNKNYYIKNKHTLSSGYFLIFDIDNFKKINDTHGHHYGDIVITQICRILKARIRNSDQFFRLGGEEFALFMMGDVFKQRVEQFLNDTLNEIRHTEFGDHRLTFRVTVSAGVCHKANEQCIDDVMLKSERRFIELNLLVKIIFFFMGNVQSSVSFQ